MTKRGVGGVLSSFDWLVNQEYNSRALTGGGGGECIYSARRKEVERTSEQTDGVSMRGKSRIDTVAVRS